MKLKNKIRTYFDNEIERETLPFDIHRILPPGSGRWRANNKKAFVQALVFNTVLVVSLIFLLTVNAGISNTLPNTPPFDYELKEVEKRIAISIKEFKAFIEQAHLNIKKGG
jgi:hypothetical protein